ncbi:MAG: hypothetical protein ABW174_08310 [Flavitalea sp.]
MSFVYHSILEAVRLGRPTKEIIDELTEQSTDDSGRMLRILITDMVNLIGKNTAEKFK